MIHSNKHEFRKAIKSGKRLLGLDLGSKTIGVAVSDPGLSIASPLLGLTRTKFTEDVVHLRKICDEYNVGGIVVGLPVNMNGSEGPAAQSARHFAMNLLNSAAFKDLDMPILFWDERLSTEAVTDLMLEHDTTRKRREKAVDKLAAAYILQGAMDGICTPET